MDLPHYDAFYRNPVLQNGPEQGYMGALTVQSHTDSEGTPRGQPIQSQCYGQISGDEKLSLGSSAGELYYYSWQCFDRGYKIHFRADYEIYRG